jgi:hypothetical protein
MPVGGIAAAETTITVQGAETDAVYSGSTVWKAVAVRKTDRSWITRTVTDIAPSGGNSVITVGAAWEQDVALNAIDRVSWLPLWRMASDTMTMSWPLEDVARIKLPMQMIETLAVE